jgi:hypothetical protein
MAIGYEILPFASFLHPGVNPDMPRIISPRIILSASLLLLCGGCIDASAPGPLSDTPVQSDTIADGTALPVDTTPQPDTNPTPQDTTIQPDTSTPPADTTPPPDTTPADTQQADTGGSTPLSGGILVGELDSEPVNTAFATARLHDYKALPEVPPEFFPCAVADTDPDDESPPEFGYDAGTITVTGLLMPLVFSTVNEGNDGIGYTSDLPEDTEDLLPAGGALISISAAGGNDVAAFSGVVQTPEPVTISAPATGLFKNQSTGSDMTVTWNKGTGELILITLTPLTGTFQAMAGKSALCSLEGDAGTAIVSSQVLEAVRNGAGSQNIALGVTRIRTGKAKNDVHTIPLTLTRSSGGLLTLKP